MPVVSLRFQFRQPFQVPAPAAYAWCTDFGPGDGALFPGDHRRSVRQVGPDTILLTDTTFPGGKPLRIHRLVRLDPDQKAWTSTHLDGPYRHSQYWYRVVPDGPRASHLEYTGLRVLTVPSTPTARGLERLRQMELRDDSGEWRERIAPALERDLGQ